MAATSTTRIELETPIEFGDETIKELTFRPGRFGDLRGIEIGASMKLSMDSVITIASRMSSQPEPAIKLLGEADIGKVLDVVMGFFERSLATGRTPSES